MILRLNSVHLINGTMKGNPFWIERILILWHPPKNVLFVIWAECNKNELVGGLFECSKISLSLTGTNKMHLCGIQRKCLGDILDIETNASNVTSAPSQICQWNSFISKSFLLFLTIDKLWSKANEILRNMPTVSMGIPNAPLVILAHWDNCLYTEFSFGNVSLLVSPQSSSTIYWGHYQRTSLYHHSVSFNNHHLHRHHVSSKRPLPCASLSLFQLAADVNHNMMLVAERSIIMLLRGALKRITSWKK